MNYLDALEQQLPAGVETLTAEIQVYKQQAGACVVEIGRRLIQAKELLPHGQWAAWLAEKVEFSERTAQRFMRVAEGFSNPTPVSDLGLSKALLLLQVPEEEREEFLETPHDVSGEEKTVQEMSKRELEKVIKERDEARKQAETARSDAEQWKKTADGMELQVKAAQESQKAADASYRELAREFDQTVKRGTELEQKVRQLEAAAKAEPIPAEIVPDEETIRRIREEVSAEQAKAIQEANARAEQAAAALQKAQNVEAIRTNMIFSNLQDIAGRLAESFRALDVQQPETAERFRAAVADFYESRANALREPFEGDPS